MNPVNERHYRVGELVELWKFSRSVIIRLFRAEPGVLKFGTGRYITLSIPESVALRVHQTLSQAPPGSVSYTKPPHVLRMGNETAAKPMKVLKTLPVRRRQRPAEW